MSIEMETLKNGATVGKNFLPIIMNSLRRLLHQNSIAFIEFVRHCRDEQHVLNPNHVSVLKMVALLQDSGRVHHQIRDIVLSAVINDGIEMEIVDPLA